MAKRNLPAYQFPRFVYVMMAPNFLEIRNGHVLIYINSNCIPVIMKARCPSIHVLEENMFNRDSKMEKFGLSVTIKFFMKTALISDIHGNFEALKARLKEIDRLKVDRIFLRGGWELVIILRERGCQESKTDGSPLCHWQSRFVDGRIAVFVLVPKSVNDCLEYQGRSLVCRISNGSVFGSKQ